MIFKPMSVHKPKLIKRYTNVYYEYVQQPEILEQLSKQIEEVLNPYKNRDDIEIHIAKGTEHPTFENDCLSIKVQIMVKPRKEIKYETKEELEND